jgi:hypothetical protein
MADHSNSGGTHTGGAASPDFESAAGSTSGGLSGRTAPRMSLGMGDRMRALRGDRALPFLPHNTPIIPLPEPMLAWMQRMRDFVGVEEILRRKGQVLVYRGHFAPGLYVATRGAVGLYPSERFLQTAERHPAIEIDAPFIFPVLDELEWPMGVTAAITRDAQFLFAPRAVVEASELLRQHIRATNLPLLSGRPDTSGLSVHGEPLANHE